MDPTSKFQEVLHVALLPVAPGLSATHATRCRRTETQASLQNACSKCGTYSLEGMSRISILRGPSQASGGKASTSRTLTKTCGLCGWRDTLVIPPSSKASAFPRMKRGRRVGAATAPQAAQPPPIPAVPAVEYPPAPKTREAVTITSPPAPTTQQARPRPKKKKSSALQEMLARNKQNSQVQSKEGAEGTHGKLAAFLSDL